MPAKAKTKKKSKDKKTVKAQATEKRQVGRPSAYKPEYAEQAKKLILLGVTDDEMAGFFGVIKQTIYNWRKEFPEFLDPVAYKSISDAEVAASAHKLATGYDYEVERVIGKGDNAKVVKIKAHVPANPVAQQHWLRNRRRKEWGDTKQVEVGGPGEFDQMDVDQLRDFILAEQEAIGLYDAEPGSDALN